MVLEEIVMGKQGGRDQLSGESHPRQGGRTSRVAIGIFGLFVCLSVGAVFLWRLEGDNGSGLGCITADSSSGSGSATSGKRFTAEKTREYRGDTAFFKKAPKQDRPLYPTVPGQKSCTQWAVMTTIFEPSLAVEQLGNSTDWCTVVVGDKKSPKTYSVPGPGHLVYLTPEMQESLPYKIIPLLAWNSFARKNLGFLYAIHHGAQLIYDFDDDNMFNAGEAPLALLRDLTDPAPTHPAERLELHEGVHVYNPYFKHFQSKHKGKDVFTWPRGIPLEFTTDARTYDEYQGKTNKGKAKDKKADTPGQVTIVQSLADHDPDVDAIYRLTQPLPLTFALDAPPVSLPAGVFAPFNAQAVVFAKPAFWGLLMPVSVHGRVSDIWRSYSTQRLMWDVGQRLSFCSPFVAQCRNPHSYLADLESEQGLQQEAGAYLKLLLAWKPEATSLTGRIEELAIMLYEHEILKDPVDVQVSTAWLEDLHAVGYEFPEIHLNIPEFAVGSPKPNLDLDVEVCEATAGRPVYSA